MNPTLSIIVPVYKVEKYIHKCISSILNQTFTDFELILIDDGSPDNCGAICDDYAKEDIRVIVIHQKNQGLSAARNAGLDIAKGKYITFVDSDDSISIDTYYDNMEILSKDISIDVLEYPYQKVYNNRIELVTDPVNHIYGYSKNFRYWALESNKGPNVWSKIFKRHIFENIRFPYGKVYEDLYILPEISERVHHLYVSDKGKYSYLIRKESISNGDYPLKREQPLEKQLDHYDAWLKVNEILKQRKTYSLKLINNFYRIISAFIFTEIDYPNYNYSIYENQFNHFKFKTRQIINSQLTLKQKIKLLLIKFIGIKKMIILNRLKNKTSYIK
ncbi:glycosyltransferase [uncultured Bacteroides sp.]|uniref:glycosyltransferase family 2 protein n=1 Tax=uncultured Bacteroides sp. TaxID=162156 RepID=UPI002AA61FB0|nr:glycosyltransferase [uncultured Bacteroides sp.]